MDNHKNLTVDEIFTLAIEQHQKNNLKVAVDHYKKILEINPNHVFSYNNIGVVLKQVGENQKAKDYFERAIEINPNYVDALNNLGSLYGKMGDTKKAKDYLERTIEISPNYVDAYSNLGSLCGKMGDTKKAIECYEKAIKINPDYPIAHNNLGVIFNQLGQDQKAKNYFERAIEISPNYADALNNLGGIFYEAEDFKKAINYFEKAMKLSPNNPSSYKYIATTYESLLDIDKATNYSYQANKLNLEQSKIEKNISLFRLKHDVEQAKYLSSKNYNLDGIDKFQKIGDEILNRPENKEDKNNSDKKILLNQEEINSLLPFFKSNCIYKPKKILKDYINPDKNWQAVEDEYFNSTNQIIYIDNFLSIKALEELREFCLVSKVWLSEYDNKYLGAFSELGFTSPLHLQIAIDLQKKLPKLFGPHKLGKMWGFKYDSTLGKGINIHADAAIHNLNFWITPDEYNNNSAGGLKVYDTSAPSDWTFNTYNASSDKIYKFLKDNNANCINVPYKFNRAVLFNSAYFHETDEIDFKDQYEGRRINNTYLFGIRPRQKKNSDN